MTRIARPEAAALDDGSPAPPSLALYTSMRRIREFELQARRLFMQGADGVRGAMHDSIGQEAVTAGVIAALRQDDPVMGSHRGHAQVIAKGCPPEAAFAELLGRTSGLCRGKGGSMHLTSVEHGHYGCSAIVGAQLPMMAGMALGAKLQGRDRVTAAFFGEGAANIGAFHETLNLAALWRLPVIFVCENNQYTEHGPAAALTSTEHPAADRAAGYGLPRVLVDGNDVEEVFTVAGTLVEQARKGQGPFVIEANTYRINGHGLMDAAKYRPKEEVEYWKSKDPIKAYRQVLESRGMAGDELDRLEHDVLAEFQQAVELAKQAPHATADQVLEDLWADGGASWRS